MIIFFWYFNLYLVVDACRPPGGPEIVCENDGYCIPNTSDDGWECLCKADFYGKNCETRKFVSGLKNPIV